MLIVHPACLPHLPIQRICFFLRISEQDGIVRDFLRSLYKISPLSVSAKYRSFLPLCFLPVIDVVFLLSVVG